MDAVMFSSKTEEWATPQAFFDKLNDEFSFTLDVCSTDENAKCKKHYTKSDDGLAQDWSGETVWCNPPYGREMPKWIKKCSEHPSCGNVAVMLIPARTDTKAFHEYIYHKSEIRFVKGRLKFGDGKNSAPFPSMVVIFKPGYVDHDDNYVERLLTIIESCIEDAFSEIRIIMSILQENSIDDEQYISSLNSLTDSINKLRELEDNVKNSFKSEKVEEEDE